MGKYQFLTRKIPVLPNKANMIFGSVFDPAFDMSSDRREPQGRRLRALLALPAAQVGTIVLGWNALSVSIPPGVRDRDDISPYLISSPDPEAIMY